MNRFLNQTRQNAPDALLAGVCAGIAGALGWNVWVLRLLFLGFLALKTLWAAGLYVALAVLFHLASDRPDGQGARHGDAEDGGLDSPELAARNRRIEELERQFRDLEQ
jgi:phage shock protein PspC (stress-responsive transcriptional regulator)